MKTNEPNASNLDHLSAQTLAHYNNHAEEFWEGTKTHDVTQNYQAMFDALPGSAKSHARILDFGCGPGRDLLAFKALGHEPTGLDGSENFAKMAAANTGVPVLYQSFFALDLLANHFDAVFANASLFHAPSSELPTVLAALYATLKPAGVLFCSNPRSFDVDREGENEDGRYATYLTESSWRRLVAEAGFNVQYTYLRPAGKPANEQPWLAMVSVKP
jgi:SAM-dependent methyltransferase